LQAGLASASSLRRQDGQERKSFGAESPGSTGAPQFLHFESVSAHAPWQ